MFQMLASKIELKLLGCHRLKAYSRRKWQDFGYDGEYLSQFCLPNSARQFPT
jgi:hypothetical protein